MGAHARALLAAGAQVTILAGRGRAAPPGARMVRIPEMSSTHPSVLRDLRALATGTVTEAHVHLVDRLTRALRPHLRRADRVVVHNVMTMHKSLALTEAIGRLAPEVPGRVIAWTHDIAWLDPRYGAERHGGYPWDVIARPLRAVRYVAVSGERARQLSRLFRIRRSVIGVVPNGIDLAARLGMSRAGNELAQRLGLFEADPFLLLPARLTRRKRIDVAVDALRSLRGRHPRAALVVTGPPGPHNLANRAYLSELRSRARRVRGVQLLHALGVRATDRVVVDLFALADAVVIPSEAEGFGIPMLEAGVHGVPVICSDLPTLRALAGSAATYVPADADGPTLARAIERRLAADPVARLRRSAKEHGWARVGPLVLRAILG